MKQWEYILCTNPVFYPVFSTLPCNNNLEFSSEQAIYAACGFCVCVCLCVSPMEWIFRVWKVIVFFYGRSMKILFLMERVDQIACLFALIWISLSFQTAFSPSFQETGVPMTSDTLLLPSSIRAWEFSFRSYIIFISKRP